MLTIRKKRPEADVTVTEATATDATVPTGVGDMPPTPVATPLGLEPAAMGPSGAASSKSYTAFAIIGIIAAVCLIALLALQFTEFSFYKADPSVWPVK